MVPTIEQGNVIREALKEASELIGTYRAASEKVAVQLQGIYTKLNELDAYRTHVAESPLRTIRPPAEILDLGI